MNKLFQARHCYIIFQPFLKCHQRPTVYFFSSKTNIEFEEAKQKLNVLKNEPDNFVKLQIYALFKQSTTGKNETDKPSTLNFVAKVKWDAWSALGNMSKEEAQSKYIELINNLANQEKNK